MDKNLIQCSRCRIEESKRDIPTHQYVKFGDEPDKVKYLCGECWRVIRAWYNIGKRLSDN